MTVDGLENVGIIREISICKKINKHSVCNVQILLDDYNDIFKLKHKIGSEVCVEDDTRIVMRGTIREISFDTAFSKSIANVKILSFSDRVDMEAKSRVYQDTQKRYNDIFRVLNTQDASFQIIDRDFSNKKEELLIVQDEMTDFEFAVSQARMHGLRVFVNDTDKKPVIDIGLDYGGIKETLAEEDMILVTSSLSEQEETWEIETRKFLELGHLADVDNNSFTVVAIDILYCDSETVYRYKLDKVFQNENVQYETLQLGRAKVIDNDDPDKLGRVQVEFLDIEDALNENRIWISYIPLLTEKDAGIVLMPDKDEIIHIFVEKGKCYANGCIREVKLNQEQENVENRTLYLRDKKIMVSDQSVEMEMFSYKWTLKEDSYTLSNEKAELIVKDDEIFVQFGDSNLKLSEDSIQLRAKKNTDIKAVEITINGSSKINAKTSAFIIE